MSWHFHWSLAPVFFMFGVLCTVVALPVSRGAAQPLAPPTTPAVQPASVVASGALEVVEPDIGALADAAAMEEIDRQRSALYQACVDEGLIGDRCRSTFYPEGAAEVAANEAMRRQRRHGVDVAVHYLEAERNAKAVGATY